MNRESMTQFQVKNSLLRQGNLIGSIGDSCGSKRIKKRC